MVVNSELPRIQLIFKCNRCLHTNAHHYKTPNKSLPYIKNKYIIEVKLLYRGEGTKKKRRSGSVGHDGPSNAITLR